MPAKSQLVQEAAPIIEVVIFYLAGADENVKLLFYYPGQFQWKELTILRPGVEGDPPLVIKEWKAAIGIPDTTRTDV